MKTRTKALLLTMSAVLLVIATVMATVAYRTSTTEVVKNTFTVGNVKITLDEARVTALGVKDGDDRVTTNTYNLLPNHSYLKDPTVHVDANSSDCWLFVKVVNEIADIETGETGETVAEQMAENGWVALNGVKNVYYLNRIATKDDTDIVVFEKFKINSNLTNESLSAYDGKTITVQAYAVQADGFGTAADAWNAAPCTWGTVAEVTTGA